MSAELAERFWRRLTRVERYEAALKAIRDREWVENALDPQWPAKIASEALANTRANIRNPGEVQ